MAAILSASKPPPPGGDDDISKPVTGKGRSNHHSHPDTSELLDTRSQNDGSVTAGNKLSEWLTVSPYHEPEHLLDLRSLDTQNRLLALALTSLEPGSASGEYAIIKYEQAFDWTKVMARLKSLAESEGIRWRRQEFYVVEFRSKLLEKIDNDLLFKLDRESHREATHSGGLLKYWFGTPDAERRNLATCLWRSKEDAIKGGRGPYHKQARAIIPQMYEEINVHGLRLTIEEDVHDWSFALFS